MSQSTHAAPDTPIPGLRRIAARFGISTSALKRWLSDAEVSERLRLRDFVFKLGGRWATTERLAGQFVDHVRSIDPRERALREVAELRREERHRETFGRGSKAGGRPAPVPVSSEVPS